MVKKSAVVAMLLLVVGLVPLDAVIGFCSRMPCCAHEEVPDLAIDRPDCCGTVACAETDPASARSAAVVAAITPAVLQFDEIVPLRDRSRSMATIAFSPPPLRLRLATISTLLI